MVSAPTSNLYWGQQVLPRIIPTNPANSDQSTADTIATMKQLVLKSMEVEPSRSILHQVVNDASARVYSRCGGHVGVRDLIRELYWWVKGHVTFREDEEIARDHLGFDAQEMLTKNGAIDLLIPPYTLLAMPRPEGDCDDFSMLLASLLVTAGIPAAFVTVAADRAEPHRFSHVYVQATILDESSPCCCSLDASHGNYPGWETSEIYRKMIWAIN